jgi:predicted Zn-dependent protease
VLGRDTLFGIVERALECSPGDQTEIVISNSSSYLTRYAGNAIHQNVGEREQRLIVRVVLGQRIGAAETNSLSDHAVREAVSLAARLARVMRPVEGFRSLPGPAPLRTAAAWDDEVNEMPAPRRADAVAAIADIADDHGLKASGAVLTRADELAVGNSLGVRAYHPSTMAQLSVVMDSGESTGYAHRISHRADEVDQVAAASEAADGCLRGRGARTIGPGEYEVVLRPYAVATLVTYLARLAFGARAYQEGRSALAGRLGQRVASPALDLWDDGRDEAGLPVPFDYEGVPKRRLALLESGVAANLCYDTLTASRAGRESTGHAMPPGGAGPAAQHLCLAPGTATVDDMIADTRRGLLVTRFHYTNTVHAARTMVTGMTRDGVWLIEDGRVAGPVCNLRFGQSVLEALSDVRAVGSQLQLVGGGGMIGAGRTSAARVPAVRLGRFRFTS